MKNTSSIFISSLEKVNQHFFKNIIQEAQEKAYLLNNMIMIIGLSSWQTFSTSSVAYSRLIDIKSVIIFVIFYHSTHWNNSKYIPLLIAIYMYLARAQVDIIIFLNYFSLSLFYDVLQKKPKEMTTLTIS